MLTSLRVNIFAYYIISVSSLLSFSYYVTNVLEVQNIYFISFVIVSFLVLSGVLISKFAVEPLQEYTQNLNELSNETLHELNLPISTIITNTQMLHKSLKDEKSLKRLQRIETACEMLRQRYDELDYMIKTQTQQNMREKYDLNQLLNTRIEFLKSVYPNISFKINTQNMYVLNDKIGMSKVIDNIIDNAVKYSNNSKIIDIKIDMQILYIEDFGIGMDEVEVLHIFDNYYQSNATMQGFGIGLNMVKRYCDENEIALSFKSSPNTGTVVQLKFKKI